MDDRHRTISILSLDRVAPFLDALGLGGVDRAALQRELRPWTQALLEEQPLSAGGDIVAHVAAKLGADAARKLSSAMEAFDLSNDQRFNMWMFRLIGWCRDDASWNGLKLPDRCALELRHACFEALNTDKEDVEFERMFEETLSDWDLYVYAAYRYDDDQNDPLNDVMMAITRFRLVAFWKLVCARLSPEERARLADNAQALSASEGKTFPLAPLLYPCP